MSSTKNPVHRAFGIDVASHGDLSTTKLDSNVNLEVISLGLSRTGTTSLQAALTQLGFSPSHQGVDLFRSPARTEAFGDILRNIVSDVLKAGDPVLSTRLRNVMQGYRSTTDNPINFLGPETYAAYPDARYILTVRQGGKEAWFKSLWDAVHWHFRRDYLRYLFRGLIWPVAFLRGTDDKVQLMSQIWIKKYGAVNADVYEKHNAEIKRLIPPKQLLVYDVREGWEPLCKFLDKPVPETPFPNLNDTKAMQAIYIGMMAYGTFTWAMYLGGVVGAAYLASRPDVLNSIWSRISMALRQ